LKGDSSPLGVVPLDGARVRMAPEMKNKTLAFAIETPQRVFFVEAFRYSVSPFFSVSHLCFPVRQA